MDFTPQAFPLWVSTGRRQPMLVIGWEGGRYPVVIRHDKGDDFATVTLLHGGTQWYICPPAGSRSGSYLVPNG